MFLTDGLIAKKKQLEKDLEEIENQLNFYVFDDNKKDLVAYISEHNGYFHLYNEKINNKEECIAICEWYLKTVKEL